MNRLFLSLFCVFLTLILIFSCSVEPKSIDYNLDQCAACKMMISEQQFGAELVTKKGKIYKYDAIECMVSSFTKSDSPDFAHVLVTDYENPGNFIDAKASTYLVDASRPSPMGKNVSAYKSPELLSKEFNSIDSKILNWDQLLDYLNEN